MIHYGGPRKIKGLIVSGQRTCRNQRLPWSRVPKRAAPRGRASRRVTDVSAAEGGGQGALLLCFLLGRTEGRLEASTLLSARQAALGDERRFHLTSLVLFQTTQIITQNSIFFMVFANGFCSDFFFRYFGSSEGGDKRAH